MKRCMFKLATRIIAFLLLGAIVNIAVAWGCAKICGPLQPAAWAFMSGGPPISAADEQDLQMIGWRKVPNPAQLPTKLYEHWTVFAGIRCRDIFESGVDPNYTGTVAKQTWNAAVARQIWAGWPARSMFGEIWNSASPASWPLLAWHTHQAIADLDIHDGHTIERFIPLRPVWFGFAVDTIVYAGLVWLLAIPLRCWIYPNLISWRRQLLREMQARHQGAVAYFLSRVAPKIILFLLLGATLNVLMAWACVCWSTHFRDASWKTRSHEQFWKLHPGAKNLEQPAQSLYVSGVAFRGFGVDGSWNACGTTKDFFINSIGHSFDIRAGWPFVSVRGMAAYIQEWPSRVSEIWVNAWDRHGVLHRPWKNDPPPTITNFEWRDLPYMPIWPGFAINTIFYSAILWLLFAVPGWVRRTRRIKRGLCPACAYPIRGGSSAVCTECGTPLPHSEKK